MNDKSKLISIFNLAEKQAREDFSLTEIGVKLANGEEKQQLIAHNEQLLIDAEVILNEAA